MKYFGRSFAFSTLLALAGVANPASAQTTGGRATGGIGSTGSVGSTSGGIGSNTSGIGGTGSTGGTTGSTSGRTRTATSPTNQTSGTEAISRSEDRTMADVGTATAGAGAAGGLGGLGGLGLGGGGFGGLGGLSPFGLNPFGTGAGTSQSKPNIRTHLRSEVSTPLRAPGAAVAIAQRRVSTSLARPRFQGVGLTVTETGAVLTGNVRSEADRRMAELLLRLEPGVNQIENRITVSP